MRIRILTSLALVSLSLALAGCEQGRTAAGPPPPAPEGMVYVPGGTFAMGSDHGMEDEAPVHEVTIRPFFIDRHEVTNQQFAAFVKATGYRTVSERMGWSAVFDQKAGMWRKVDGADWRHPEGPGSSLEGKDDYPVVQVAWDDAAAYAKWAGKRLLTEAEFELAARGGLQGKEYAWGDELRPDGKFFTNSWQGEFPKENTGEDGYQGLAPVMKFPANGYGLYDLTGNAWEWVADWYSPTYYRASARENPTGPPSGEQRVIRGGSFLCAENYCTKYRVAGRNQGAVEDAWNHTSFRCAQDVP
ncbi:MAG: formylglycine-generating enzyme family protein [Armatimonadota bacterium]